MTELLRKVAFELDNEIGSMGTRLETLEDVKVLFGFFKEDMDSLV